MSDEPRDPKLVKLAPRDELQAASDAAERALPILIEHAARTAKLRRAMFTALVKEGFTEAQALDLCWRQ